MRANPLPAFVVVVVVAILYFGALGAATDVLLPRPVPDTMHLPLALSLVYIVPVAICGWLQFVLTRDVPARAWWRVLQVVTASLLGPYIGASAVFLLGFALGGKM